MKTILVFLFCFPCILLAQPRSLDSVIVILNPTTGYTVTLPCNDKDAYIRMTKAHRVDFTDVKKWAEDSFTVEKKVYHEVKSATHPHRKDFYYTDTTYTLAYADITGIRQNLRNGSLLDGIVGPVFLVLIVAGIAEGDEGALIAGGVLAGLYALQAVLFPYEKMYRFDKKWKLASIAGHVLINQDNCE